MFPHDFPSWRLVYYYFSTWRDARIWTKIHDALLMISTEDPVPIRSRREDIPEGLAQIIHRALSRDVKARFEDVNAFRKALKEWA